MEPRFLGYEHAIRLHVVQIEAFGGSHGIRDAGLLESALAMPQSGFGGEYLHRDLFEMAAAYCFHIAMNHPFIDGNKRTALMAADVFLKTNGYELTLTSAEAYDLVIGVCEGTVTKGALAAKFRDHAVLIEAE